jgi:hypothetical protein
MRARTPFLLLFALLATGCFVHRFDRNAPGHVDLDSPPAVPEDRTPEAPRDPGDQELLLAAGAAFSGGFLWGDPAFALETAIRYRQYDRTALNGISPNRSLGVAFGWSPSLTDDQGAHIYAELQARFWRNMIGIAPGYCSNVRNRTQGPQLAAFFGPTFLRVWHLEDGETALWMGLTLETSFAFRWSR